MAETHAPGHRCTNGVLYCTAPQPAAFYQEDPAQVLALLIAAAQGPSIAVDTYAAAMAAMPALACVPAAAMREAVQHMLLSPAPHVLDALLGAGVLEPYGLAAPQGCLRGLNDVPCTMETRWWALLRLCDADNETVCARFGFAPAFARALAGLDRLAATPCLPADVPALKRLLGRLPDLDDEAALQTMAAHHPRWQGTLALYQTLRAGGQPYRVRHLAVTRAELVAAGIRGKRADRVLQGLLDAVRKAPQVNTQPALMALARVLARQ